MTAVHTDTAVAKERARFVHSKALERLREGLGVEEASWGQG